MAEPNPPDDLPTESWAGPSGSPDPTPADRGPAFGGMQRPKTWQAPPPEQLQASFPQYEIRALLGRGGMGAVYQAWQKSLRRLVAIKVLPPTLDDDGVNFVERFRREAQALARFSHPGIVSVHDAGETAEGLFYFVMEYVKGTDLQQLLAAQGVLSVERVLVISSQICEALAYAHEREVIHRDIKPSNIMIDDDGQVKVADFGIAKVLNDETSALYTGTHVRMGTPDYMAPEVFHGVGVIDHRADLYAVGVMLYQMLTGEVPHGRFDWPSARRPGLDVRFDAIVDRAMHKDPEKRYANAGEIHQDLERIGHVSPRGASLPRRLPDGSGSTVRTPRLRQWRNAWLKWLEQGLLTRWSIFIGFMVCLAGLIYSDTRSQPIEKVFIAFMFCFTALAQLRINHPRTYEQNSRLLLLFAVMLVHLLIVQFILVTSDSQILRGANLSAPGGFTAPERQQLWKLAIPYAYAPLVLAVSLGRGQGSYAAVFVSLWGAMVYRHVDVIFLSMSLICGSVAVLILFDGKGRVRLVRTGVAVGLVTWFLAFAFGLIGPIDWGSGGTTPWKMIGLQSVIAIGSGILTAFMVGGTLPIIEGAFRTTSSLPPTVPQPSTPLN
jgi:serine/threonine protein kinase